MPPLFFVADCLHDKRQQQWSNACKMLIHSPATPMHVYFIVQNQKG